ncbi:MAG: PaaI family thioesterase [Robiginitomaculum sp.]|nr:PaaI family thioesterase [Robiginitomaculum sp.]
MTETLSLDAKVKQALDSMPYANTLAIRPILMGEDLTFVLPYSPDIIGNPMLKALHGGAIGAFLETAAIVGLGIVGDTLALPKPIGINIDYLRRGHPKDTYARAVISRLGSRVANVRVKAWQDSVRTPIAILHGNFLITKPQKK